MTVEQNISDELGRNSQAAGSEPRYAALQAVIDRAVSLGLADSVSITEIRPDGLMTRVSSDLNAAQADELQYRLGEGPCVDAAGDIAENIVISNDTKLDERWPGWGPTAAEGGCGAVISVQLFTIRKKPIGAVNLFHRIPQDYQSNDLDAAALVATHASIALAQGRHDENLWRAIDGRHVIGMAQGIIIQRFSLGPDEAYQFLSRVSQRANTKLHLVAEQIIRTRRIPGVDDH